MVPFLEDNCVIVGVQKMTASNLQDAQTCYNLSIVALLLDFRIRDSSEEEANYSAI